MASVRSSFSASARAIERESGDLERVCETGPVVVPSGDRNTCVLCDSRLNALQWMIGRGRVVLGAVEVRREGHVAPGRRVRERGARRQPLAARRLRTLPDHDHATAHGLHARATPSA